MAVSVSEQQPRKDRALNGAETQQSINTVKSALLDMISDTQQLGRFAVASAGLGAKTGAKKGAEEFFLKACVNKCNCVRVAGCCMYIEDLQRKRKRKRKRKRRST
jgi:hypothetical protein